MCPQRWGQPRHLGAQPGSQRSPFSGLRRHLGQEAGRAVGVHCRRQAPKERNPSWPGGGHREPPGFHGAADQRARGRGQVPAEWTDLPGEADLGKSVTQQHRQPLTRPLQAPGPHFLLPPCSGVGAPGTWGFRQLLPFPSGEGSSLGAGDRGTGHSLCPFQGVDEPAYAGWPSSICIPRTSGHLVGSQPAELGWMYVSHIYTGTQPSRSNMQDTWRPCHITMWPEPRFPRQYWRRGFRQETAEDRQACFYPQTCLYLA